MSEKHPNHINPAAARGKEQQSQYELIAESGVCPFCPEHYGTFPHQDPPVAETEHWYTIENMKPYEFTELHNVIIARRHLLSPDELTADEWLDLKENIDREITIRKLGYGAIGMRFGNPEKTGASVGHLHAHLIVPNPNEVSADKSVKFRMSKKFK